MAYLLRQPFGTIDSPLLIVCSGLHPSLTDCRSFHWGDDWCGIRRVDIYFHLHTTETVDAQRTATEVLLSSRCCCTQRMWEMNNRGLCCLDADLETPSSMPSTRCYTALANRCGKRVTRLILLGSGPIRILGKMRLHRLSSNFTEPEYKTRNFQSTTRSVASSR